MSTRLISWQQLVTNADPQWYRQGLQPWAYQFSNGRLFYEHIPVYSFEQVLGQEEGFAIVDESGNAIGVS